MLTFLPEFDPLAPNHLAQRRQLHHPPPIAVPHQVGAVDQHEVLEQFLLANAEAPRAPRRVCLRQIGLLFRARSGGGAGEVFFIVGIIAVIGRRLFPPGAGTGWRLQPQRFSRRLHRHRLIAAVLEDAEHIEGVILVPIGERIGAMVREQAAFADGDPRQAGAGMRTQPLPPVPGVAVRFQQALQVMRPVERLNHLGQSTALLATSSHRFRRGFLWLRQPRAGCLGVTLEGVPVLPDPQQFRGQLG
ncbi:hypothetical protein FQZ97_715980 [compost metagenome]